MEKIVVRYNSLKDACNALGEVVETIKENQNLSEKLHDIYRDSLIKRFEFCYDLTWKYLKHFLEKYYGIISNSPKSVFRDLQVQNIIDEKELRLLLQMVDDRNLTSHTYNEELADTIAERIENYFAFLMNLVERVVPKS